MGDDIHTRLREEQGPVDGLVDEAALERTPGAAEAAREAAGGTVPGAIAFFDLDGTLVAGNTQALLVRFLRSARIVSRRFVASAALWYVRYKLGLVQVTEEERARAASALAGLSTKEVDRVISQFVDSQLMPRLHPGALAALREHQAAGDRVVVLSAALEPVVRWLCKELEVADYFAARCEVAGGVYSGRLEGLTPHGERKAEMALDLMSRVGADPDECWAYADHDSDIALLRSVGHPVAVHPRSGLAQAAQAAGWPILP